MTQITQMKKISWNVKSKGFKTDHWEISKVKDDYAIENRFSFYLNGTLIKDSHTIVASGFKGLVFLRNQINAVIALERKEK